MIRAPAILLATVLAAAAPPATLRAVLESAPADSLARPLERFEVLRARGSEVAEAALVLGRLHYARGEYHQAADAFARAGSRLEPARRPEARYWTGLAWLGAGDPGAARAALEESAGPGSPRRADAQLALALCWQAAHQRERERQALELLLATEPGEAGPPALERAIALAIELRHPEAAARARERLLRDYPRSIEAARAALASAVAATGPPAPTPPSGSPPRPQRPAPAPVSLQGPLAVQIGAFGDRARAQALAGQARRAGFAPVQVTQVREAGTTLHAVRVGLYATAEDARVAGERAARALGVPCRVVPAR
ncbi:MAG: SPOR domain-containing protein [Candidatus Eisenbacteria bacterium]|nr:SPOR domain-containing protein [Candidatus Eisenbacteria bacterium]